MSRPSGDRREYGQPIGGLNYRLGHSNTSPPTLSNPQTRRHADPDSSSGSRSQYASSPAQPIAWEARVPDSVKPLNDLLGVPDFFPTRGAPEERLTQESLMNGYQEPNTVSENVEFGSMRGWFSQAQPTTLHEMKEAVRLGLHSMINRKRIRKPPAPKEAPKPKKLFPHLNAVPSQAAHKAFFEKLADIESRLGTLASSISHGVNAGTDTLIRSLYENDIPPPRAVWFVKVLYLNKFYASQTAPSPPNTKAHKESSASWTKCLMTFLHRQMADYTQKLVVKKPDRVLMDRLSTLIEYVRSLLMQSYKEGIIIPDQMYTTFVEMLPQCPRPEYECLFLSVLLDYAQEMCLVQAGVRKVLQYCLNRMDQLQPSTQLPIPLSPVQARIYSMLCSLARTAIVVVPDLLVAQPDSVIERILDVNSVLDRTNTFVKEHASDNLTASTLSLTADNKPLTVRNLFWMAVPRASEAAEYFVRKSAELVRGRQRLLKGLATPSSNRVTPLETMDSWAKSFDMDSLYQQLFGEAVGRSVPPSNIGKFVFFLCDWAMHPARGDMYSVYIVSALLSRLVRRSEHKETLREHLLRYLDALSPDALPADRVARLFGELIRRQLFSYTRYIHTLISRGILHLKKDADKSKRHQAYLESFPILGDKKETDRSQRRSALNTAGSSLALQEQSQRASDLAEELIKVVLQQRSRNDIRQAVDAVMSYIKSSPRYYQVYLGEQLLEGLEILTDLTNKSMSSNSKFDLVQCTLFILETIQEYGLLCSGVCWLMAKTNVAETLLTFYIYKYERMFYALDMLPEVLDAIQSRLGDGESDSLEKLVGLIFTKYPRVEQVNNWKLVKLHNSSLKKKFGIATTNLRVKGVAKPTSVSAEVELQKLIKDNLPDVDAIQAIDKSIGGLSGQTAHICVLFVVPQALAVLSNPTNLDVCRKKLRVLMLFMLEMRKRGNFDVPLTASLSEEINHVLTSAARPGFNQAKEHAVAALLMALVIYHVVPFDFILGIVAAKLKDLEKDIRSSPTTPLQVSTAMNLVRLLSFNPKTISLMVTVFGPEEIQSAQLASRVQLASLDHSFALVSFVHAARQYYINNNSNTGVLDGFQFSNTFVFDSIVNSTSKDVYDKFKTLRDPYGSCVMLFAFLYGTDQPTLQAPEKAFSEGALEIKRLLARTDEWTVRQTWLEMQLMLDNLYTLFSRTFQTGIERPKRIKPLTMCSLILLDHVTTDIASYEVMQKLLSMLHDMIQKELSMVVFDFLDNVDVIQGKAKLTDCIKSAVMQWETENGLPVGSLTSNHSEVARHAAGWDRYGQIADSDQMQDAVCGVLINLATPCIFRAATPDERRQFVTSVVNELRAMEPLLASGSSNWRAVRRQLIGRLMLLRRCITHSRETSPWFIALDIKSLEQLAASLSTFLSLPGVQTLQCDGNDVFTIVVHTLDLLMNENPADLSTAGYSNPIYNNLRKVIQDRDDAVGGCLTTQQRLRVESLLPFLDRRDQTLLSSSTMRAPLPPNLDPWLLLEDYDDHITKIIGGKVIERKELTYASSLFEEQEQLQKLQRQKLLHQSQLVKTERHTPNSPMRGPSQQPQQNKPPTIKTHNSGGGPPTSNNGGMRHNGDPHHLGGGSHGPPQGSSSPYGQQRYQPQNTRSNSMPFNVEPTIHFTLGAPSNSAPPPPQQMGYPQQSHSGGGSWAHQPPHGNYQQHGNQQHQPPPPFYAPPPPLHTNLSYNPAPHGGYGNGPPQHQYGGYQQQPPPPPHQPQRPPPPPMDGQAPKRKRDDASDTFFDTMRPGKQPHQNDG